MWDKKYKELTELLSATFVPVLIEILIAERQVSRSKMLNSDYMHSVLQLNQCLIRRIIGRARLLIAVGDDVTDVFHLPVAAGRRLSAVLFLATAIEHVVNYLYNDLLSREDEDPAEIITTPFIDKLNWVLLLLSPCTLPEDLLQQIRMVVELKNTVACRKVVPFGQSAGAADELERRIKALDLTSLLHLPARLHEVVMSGADSRRERVVRRFGQSLDLGMFLSRKYYPVAM